MILIGESINSSIKRVREAVEARDGEYLKRLALAQQENGAAYVDVNCGTRVKDEVETMDWMVRTVASAVRIPLSIDSPRPEAVEAGLLAAGRPGTLINSITAEKERMEALIPLAVRHEAKVIALLMDDQGIPETVEDRVRIAGTLIPALMDAGIPADHILVDSIVKPIGTGDGAGLEVLDSIRAIREKYPDVHFTAGLSNISHGLPGDAEINHAFLILCIREGLDHCIANVLDRRITAYGAAAEALLGKDPWCARLLKSFRAGYFSEKQNYLDL